MKRSPPIVPREKLLGGVTICLSVVVSRLAEAVDLLTRGFVTAPSILLSFAVEELGKAAMLQQAYASGNDPATITDFYDHQAKIAAGCSFIGTPPALVDERFHALYVGWSGDWTWNEVTVDAEGVRESIKAVHDAIARTLLEWGPA